MHHFFQRRDAAFDIPSRAYALLIDGADSEFVLFDAVDADYFDRTYALPGPPTQLGSWRSHVDRAPIYAIEINASDAAPAATGWLALHPHDALPEWSQIELVPDDKGEAAVYNSIAGPPRRARVSVRPASNKLARMLAQATDLTPYVRPEDEIELALPASSIEHIFVLDVGQGSANALVTSADKVIAYVDVGSGVLKDTGTWPSSMGRICLQHHPVAILTHWHYDHFHAANIYPAAQGMTWIAPLQTLGPGPQSAMASAIANTGTLMVWSGSGILSAGKIDLERCTGPSSNQNRSGIAVWVWGSAGSDPILLPGDAGYSDIPTLVAGKAIAGLVAAHHGGRASGVAPTKPGAGTPRVALSYGHPNSYKHPLANSLQGLTASRWSIGHPAPGIDERRTEDRIGGVGGTGLGHIRMNWTGNTGPAHICSCGCTLDPTQ
ncbi:hypothetical protein [Mesorhizobium sp. L48C026A00]|uniref:hypothetical protein n=1 Tax=Mesorhizobium sp. L48C026A00 TaxID=1287182 RepID=UPI0003CFDF0D|nr:hypothetical protein [Mesorhizobium sp. L48C026A00]ESZ10198.1 hypothetical protein X737_32360 [Mesorhizobium sp. L48C026A00]